MAVEGLGKSKKPAVVLLKASLSEVVTPADMGPIISPFLVFHATLDSLKDALKGTHLWLTLWRKLVTAEERVVVRVSGLKNVRAVSTSAFDMATSVCLCSQTHLKLMILLPHLPSASISGMSHIPGLMLSFTSTLHLKGYLDTSSLLQWLTSNPTPLKAEAGIL